MGNSTPRITELTGSQTVHDNGLDRQGDHIPATDFLPTFCFCISPIVDKILGAPFVDDVVQRAYSNQNNHNDDVRLHDFRRYE